GADHLINYKSVPEWGKAAREITKGRGVDHVVEVGGAGTIKQSIRAIRPGGAISMIGVLSGPTTDLALPLIVMQNLRLQGVTVGSHDQFAAMARAIFHHRLKPVIDQVFAFDKAHEAFAHLASGAHFGKVAIEI
ncbi:MAG: zinc-binding dehydrogenase, partial [Alphaproteobacteria bacterium]|nr:zinc-binding dehydrogenase [Alphaproteobacteria bacterium]